MTEEREATAKVKRPRKLKLELKAITANHQVYINNLNANRVTLCSGKAGTGKTFIAMGIAAEMFVQGLIKKIVIARPLVECGRRMGAMPGDIDGKTKPYMIPIYDALDQFFGEDYTQKLVDDGKIIVSPLELMRGSTFRDSFIILDEAQNAEFKQLHMFLTRFTSSCKVVVTGDAEQSDIPLDNSGQNAFSNIIRRLENVDERIGVVRLGREDIVRDELIKIIDERLTSV